MNKTACKSEEQQFGKMLQICIIVNFGTN